jgi:hypothetical protein
VKRNSAVVTGSTREANIPPTTINPLASGVPLPTAQCGRVGYRWVI